MSVIHYPGGRGCMRGNRRLTLTLLGATKGGKDQEEHRPGRGTAQRGGQPEIGTDNARMSQKQETAT